jgi:phospholipase C
VDRLEEAGKSWKAYMEDMPSPCFTESSSGKYAQRHNPFIYYDDIRTNPDRCNKIVPFTDFSLDLQTNTLPDYVWITPNLCHDGHDCSIAASDIWLQTLVPQILASDAWKQNGVLFITYDEGSTNDGFGNTQGGHIATLVISPLSKPGYQSATQYSHYSLLYTIEAAWGLLPLKNDADATVMSDLFITIDPPAMPPTSASTESPEPFSSPITTPLPTWGIDPLPKSHRQLLPIIIQ